MRAAGQADWVARRFTRRGRRTPGAVISSRRFASTLDPEVPRPHSGYRRWHRSTTASTSRPQATRTTRPPEVIRSSPRRRTATGLMSSGISWSASTSDRAATAWVIRPPDTDLLPQTPQRTAPAISVPSEVRALGVQWRCRGIPARRVPSSSFSAITDNQLFQPQPGAGPGQ